MLKPDPFQTPETPPYDPAALVEIRAKAAVYDALKGAPTALPPAALVERIVRHLRQHKITFADLPAKR